MTTQMHSLDNSTTTFPPDVQEGLLRLADQAFLEYQHPEQEWCEDCAIDDEPFDENESPGMARDVVSSSVEQPPLPIEEWDETAWGPGPEYEIVKLSCGHEVVRGL